VEKWPLDSISVGYIQLFHIHDQILICVIRLHTVTKCRMRHNISVLY